MRGGVASKAQEQPQALSGAGWGGVRWELLLYLRAQPFIPPSTWMQGLQLKCVIRKLSILCRPSQTLLESTLPQIGWWKLLPPAKPLGDPGHHAVPNGSKHIAQSQGSPNFQSSNPSWKLGHALGTEPTCGLSGTDTRDWTKSLASPCSPGSRKREETSIERLKWKKKVSRPCPIMLGSNENCQQ